MSYYIRVLAIIQQRLTHYLIYICRDICNSKMKMLNIQAFISQNMLLLLFLLFIIIIIIIHILHIIIIVVVVVIIVIIVLSFLIK